MSYLDKYPGCLGCPVEKYCGTMVSCSRLCHSLKEPETAESEEKQIISWIEADNDY